MKNNRENVYDCTSSNFDGMIASAKPEDSWVCKWQRIGNNLFFLHKNKNHYKPIRGHSITTWDKKRWEGVNRKFKLGHVTKGGYHVKFPQLSTLDFGSRL